MTQISYYYDPRDDLPHKDALASWGVVLIILGSMAGLMAFAIGAMAWAMTKGVFPNPTQQSGIALLSGGIVYVIVSVALIWLGIGSRLGRRWVRPLMVILSTLVILFGIMMLAIFLALMTQITAHQASVGSYSKPPANFMFITNACGAVFILGLGIILPAVLLWFYGRASVQTTLNQMDPKPRWTDRCPIPVLGWVVACIWLGQGTVFTLIKQVYPFFTFVMVGVPADVLSIVFGLALIVGGIMCYRLRPLGWLITFTTIAILIASMLTFAFWGDHRTYFDLLLHDMPAEQRDTGRRAASFSLVSPALLNGIALVYALWIRKWFKKSMIPAALLPVS